MLVAIGFAGAANAAYFSVTGGGGQAQIGDGLPLPIQVNKTGGGGPLGTGTMFPPLLIPINPNPAKALVKQTGVNPAQMKVPPGVFLRIPASAKVIGVANNNPKVFQVKTNITFSGPANVKGTMTFKKDGWRTAPGATFIGTPPAGKAFYTNTGNRFGGASQTRVAIASAVGVWANVAGAMLPCKNKVFNGGVSTANGAACFAVKLNAIPKSIGAAGGGVATGGGKITKGTIVSTVGGFPPPPASVNVSIQNATGMISQSAPRGSAIKLDNKAVSVGFPWTTGTLTLSAMSALGMGEKFIIVGKDGRSSMGAGTISLVSGALSNRKTSGPNANKSWARYTLPEPGPTLGAAAALLVLGLCHALVRRSR
jgi:hypothetical protein